MKDIDITAFLQKADELKALFILGQRVIPFLEEIFVFVKDMKPMLDDMNLSIEENMKKMPNASKQLSKVTEANEMATTEIMDIVDGIVYKGDLISGNMKKLADSYNEKKENPFKVLELIKSAVEGDKELKEMLPEIKGLLEKMKEEPDNEHSEIVEKSNELITSIQTDSDSIMMSLQVQDISSQQIAAVNNVLITVQSKLSSILHKFQNAGISEMIKDSNVDSSKYTEKTNTTTMHREIAFDPDAIGAFDGQEERQKNIDSMMDKHSEAFDGDGEASADDIDALFASPGQTEEEPTEQATEAPANEEASSDDIDAMFSDSGNDEASTDDIDALFGNSDNDEASSDDIDALFGNSDSEEASTDDIDALFGDSDNEEASADDIDALFNS